MKSASRFLLPSVLSALLLYVFHLAINVVAALLIPWLIELMEKSPRLGALGWLALLCSPVALVASAHRVAHGVMDHVDRSGQAPETSAGMASLWAGLFAWFAMTFSSLVSALLLFAIFPPPVDEGAFAALVRELQDVRLELGTHAVLWVAVAALLYYVERRVRRGWR